MNDDDARRGGMGMFFKLGGGNCSYCGLVTAAIFYRRVEPKQTSVQVDIMLAYRIETV
jgi:hypothetical protein